MASKFALDKAANAKTVDFDYRGLKFKLSAAPDFKALKSRTAELQVKLGLRADISGIDATDDEKSLIIKASGAALVGTVVVGCESFDVEGEQFTFDKASEIAEYETQGEELLAENDVMQDAIYRHALTLAVDPPDYEVAALGKSSPHSDSGDNEMKTVSQLPTTSLG